MSGVNCQNCHQKDADVKFSWPTAAGHQAANLCNGCAGDWWQKYAHTPSGQGLQITPVTGGDGDA